MIKKIIAVVVRLIKKLTYKLNAIEVADACNKKIVNNGATFWPEAKVQNMQEDPQKIVVGEGTNIRGELQVYAYGGKITIGDNCFIGAGSKVWSGDSITIGNNVLIGHNVNIVDFSHKTKSIERAASYIKMIKEGHSKEKENIPSRPIVIEDDVIIYAGASIVMGVTIGKASIISTGSVVIKDIPPYSQVLGNPAKVVWRTK